MPNWLDRMKADPVDWLLERACPSIRYRTLTEIMDLPADDPRVFQAREEANNYKPAVTISRLQKESGTWLDKILEFEAPNPSRNRGPGMVNQCLALAEYGWDRSHPILHCSGERLLRYLVEDATCDLFELKGYAGSRDTVEKAIRRDLGVIAAALLARSGYADESSVCTVADRVLDELEQLYPESGSPDLYFGVTEKVEDEDVYRQVRPNAHVPEMFLYTLMAFHPRFVADERARSIAGRVTDHLMKGDDIPGRIREVEGRRYMKLSDLPISNWGQEEYSEGKLGYLLHDLELLARTGTLTRSPKAQELLDWALSFQQDDGTFLLEKEIEKSVSRSQYHYFPLEDSWRGKHKRFTDVTFRMVLILKILDKTCPG